MRCKGGLEEMNTIQHESRSAWIKFLPYLILLVIFAVVPAFVNKTFWLNAFIVVFAKMICTSGLRTISLSGDMSFAQGAFMGIGAYTAAILSKSFGVPAYLTIPIGGIAAMLIGVITGLPFARLRSLYYCMTTMFLGVFIIYLFQSGGDVTGGYQGLKRVPKLFSDTKASYYFFLGLAVVCILAMYRFEHSRIGNTLKAISQSHDVAASIGVNEKFFRLLAIGVGCFFAGIAGAAYAHYNAQVTPNTYGMTLSLWLLMFFMIGGKDSFFGPIIGTTVLGLINESSRVLSTYAPYAAAAAMILVAYLLPGGLSSIPELFRRRKVRKAVEASLAGASDRQAIKKEG